MNEQILKRGQALDNAIKKMKRQLEVAKRTDNKLDFLRKLLSETEMQNVTRDREEIANILYDHYVGFLETEIIEYERDFNNL